MNKVIKNSPNKLSKGMYFKYHDDETVHWSDSVLNVQPDISFESPEQYFEHRMKNNFPCDWSNISIKKIRHPCIIFVQTKYETLTQKQIKEIENSSKYETFFFLRDTKNKIINEKIQYYNTKDFDFSLIKDIVIKEYLQHAKCKCGRHWRKCYLCPRPKTTQNFLKQFFKKYDKKKYKENRDIVPNLYNKYHTHMNELWKKLFQIYNVPKNEIKNYTLYHDNYIFPWENRKQDYFIYLNDTITIKNIDKTIDNCFEIFLRHNKSKDLFTLSNDIDQIIFFNENKNIDNVDQQLIRNSFYLKDDSIISFYLPNIKNNLLDNYYTFELIKDVISSPNPYCKHKDIYISYEEYVKKKYPSYNMRLLPGIIDTKNFLFDYYSKQKKDTIWQMLDLTSEFVDSVWATCAGEASYNASLNAKSNNTPLESLGRIKLKNNKFSENFFSVYYENIGYKTVYVDADIKKNVEQNIEKKTENNNNLSTIKNSDVTIVTGFLNIKIKRKPKEGCETYNYLDKSKDTLKIDQNMVIYVSNDLVKFVTEFRKEKGLLHKTKIIEINIEENLYLFEDIETVRKNVEKNKEPYNLAEYILAVNSRYGYLNTAIQNNYFNTDYFMWIDFSAGHIINMNLSKKNITTEIDKVRIAWISRIDKDVDYFHFKYNHQCLAGGLFMGHKDQLTTLICLHNMEFKRLMGMGYHINDDKLLFLIYLKYPTLFDIYNCGYNKVYEYL